MQLLAEAHDQSHIVIDDQETQAAGCRQAREYLQKVFRLPVVHARGWLIEQQETRIAGKRSGYFHPALVAKTEFANEIVVACGKIEFIQQFPARALATRIPEPWLSAAAATFSNTVRLPKWRPI